MRNSCLSCTRKHLSAAQIFYIESFMNDNPVPYFVNCFQAIILHMESLMGYPEHKWLVIGNLNVAEYKLYNSSEDENSDYMKLSHFIRSVRTKYIEENVFDKDELLVALNYNLLEKKLSKVELQNLVSGNVMEAINEVLDNSEQMSQEIDQHFKLYQDDKKYDFPFMELIHAISYLAEEHECLPEGYLENLND